MHRKEGDKIVYDLTQHAVEGNPINASFSDAGGCLTECKRENVQVGSLSCTRCEHFGGSERFAVATGGTGQYGSASETRNIYCKKA